MASDDGSASDPLRWRVATVHRLPSLVARVAWHRRRLPSRISSRSSSSRCRSSIESAREACAAPMRHVRRSAHDEGPAGTPFGGMRATPTRITEAAILAEKIVRKSARRPGAIDAVLFTLSRSSSKRLPCPQRIQAGVDKQSRNTRGRTGSNERMRTCLVLHSASERSEAHVGIDRCVPAQAGTKLAP
jgi:hypothetical protein